MIYSENNALQAACLHIVGNKSLDEGVSLSAKPITIDGAILPVLNHFFISSFKSDERYEFFHHSGLEFNFVYKVVSGIFNNPNTLYDSSVMLANQLYDCSEHNKLKGGEFYVTYFKEIEIDGKKADAVGLFKSENKDVYLRIISQDGSNDIEQENGVNINKLDKGCLIFNLEPENGYVVAIIDNTNKVEAKYWVEDFLQAKPRSDEYHQTRSVLSAAKSFIMKGLPSEREVTKGEQAELMDKTLRYFQENEKFDIADFGNTVMGDDQLSSDFGQYMGSYMEKNNLEQVESFDISSSAVKKSSRSMKSVIKLDKNFHIYVHGGEGLIKRGYDEATGMEYYQLYFKTEE